MITPEQDKVVGKCKRMLKWAFPDLNGKCIFRMDRSVPGARSVKFDVYDFDIKVRTDPDKEVAEVDLR